MDESGIGPDPSGPDNGKSSHPMVPGNDVIMLQTWAPSFVLLFCFFDMYLVNVHALLKNMLMFRNLTQRSLLLSYGEILHFTLFCAYLMSHPSHPP